MDNQSVLASLTNAKATSGQHLTNHLILLANQTACSLGIHWISNHSKVKGNEKADELAKEAANGLSSARANLPNILRTPLPDGASATKQNYHGKLKERWEKTWETSRRSQRLNLIDDNFPFNSFRKRTYMLTRNQASLMTQIRSGHFPLNSYLFKIDRSDTDRCQSCRVEGSAIQHKETVKHYIFECTAYRRERAELISKTYHYLKLLKTLLKYLFQ